MMCRRRRTGENDLLRHQAGRRRGGDVPARRAKLALGLLRSARPFRLEHYDPIVAVDSGARVRLMGEALIRSLTIARLRLGQPQAHPD